MALTGPLWLEISEARRKVSALLAKRLDSHLSGFIGEFFLPFKIGDYLDVKDTIGVWYPAKILDFKATAVYVQYMGWKDQWNEWIEWQSPRLAPRRTNTPRHISPSDYPRMYQQLVSGNDAGARGMLVIRIIPILEVLMVKKVIKSTKEIKDVILQNAQGTLYRTTTDEVRPLPIENEKFKSLSRYMYRWGQKHIQDLMEEAGRDEYVTCDQDSSDSSDSSDDASDLD